MRTHVGEAVILGCCWVASYAIPSLTTCCFVEAPSVVSVAGVLTSHIRDSRANITKERNEKPWRVPGFLLCLWAAPSCRSTGTAGRWEVSAVPGSSCWGAWGTAFVPGMPRFVDSTIKCYRILICYLLIFHFLCFWHSIQFKTQFWWKDWPGTWTISWSWKLD